MKIMTTKALRTTFLDYFASQSHLIVPSSSLIPSNDPSLLFTNAGMVQFKDIFLGLEKPPSLQAASSQRCLRAGGKHNDLENVGYTARHHTFFEMLGNFSFGAYFKEGAIKHAFHFLTEVLKIPVERLWITVFEEDKEAEDLWINMIGIDPARLSRCGTADNFWSMGDTGPCGPCTEIYYDHGPNVAGGPPGSADAEGDRYVEIWNLVFMQYNRDAAGNLSPLPKPAVDTGMGLERIAAVMQGVHNNYDIDLFRGLIDSLCVLGSLENPPKHALRAVADHIRACAFLIADGVVPGNEGRSYVLRRIARRAMRHGHALGFKEPFFHHLVKPLVLEMGQSYPLLQAQAAHIEHVLYQEAVQFDRTLELGLKIVEQDLAAATNGILAGDKIFKLYDTYGFPVDLTADIARERGIKIDREGFEQAMQAQKTRARDVRHFAVQHTVPGADEQVTSVTGFIGYEVLMGSAKILACYDIASVLKQHLKAGDKANMVLDHTPFYAEAGGQVGDQGILRSPTGVFEVHHTYKVGTRYFHQGVMREGSLAIGDTVEAMVDKQRRLSTARNHSATHLLNAALRQVLGTHIQQKGSLVEAHRLRFDFSHAEALTQAELLAIEHSVNQKILENTLVQTEVLPVAEALAQGAMALFGEKYGESVRVLSMGDRFSVELCGGTHAERTGDIGCFKITGEYGVASGVRRLEAITGEAVLAHCMDLENQLGHVATMMNTAIDALPQKITQLLARNRSLEKELQQTKTRLSEQAVQGTGESPPALRLIQGKKILAVKLPVGDLKTLREQAEHLRDQWGLSVVVVAGIESEDTPKVNVVALVAKAGVPPLQANTLLKYVVEQLGGQGGGRTDMAQGGGNQPENIATALGSVYDFVEKALHS